MPRRDRAVAPPQTRLTVLAIVVGMAVMVQPGSAGLKVRVDFDKAFDFRQARTWGWHPQDAGYVRVARTPDDDPEAIRKRAEPLIISAVRAEMPRRGLTQTAGTPDLTLAYFLLLTVGTSAQTVGQFLPSAAEWRIPPSASATMDLEVIEQGSFVLDVSAHDRVVWRGIAEARIKMDLDQEKRAQLIRDAIRQILERYPPKT